MFYPAKFIKEGEHYNISFRDIPEAITRGYHWEDGLNMAEQALLKAMTLYFEQRRKICLPSEAQEGEVLITLPISVFAKVLLLNELIEQKISNADLARRINLQPQEIQRIVNLKHSTKIDTISRAISATGKRLVLYTK